MKILVACEFSGVVRSAMRAKGHDTWSCDLRPTDDGSEFHLQRDVTPLLGEGWDMLIAFPPCTYLASSGARWWKGRETQQSQALEFVRTLFSAPISRIALENPVGRISTAIRKPDQIIQPWQFGHGETKATCLWLKNLAPLRPTNIVSGRESRIHSMSQSENRSKLRSITYLGIARAMADQWG